MKRKNQYLLIGIAVALVIIGLLLWLLRRQAEINKEHISINFEVHNCASVETNKELLRNDFLMPLLMHSFVKEASGLENLIIPSVSSNKLDFSIPVIGINSFRYNSNAESLRLSNITSTSRQDDEKTFFSNWEAVGYADIEQSLLKGNPKNKNNKELPSLYDIIQSENDDVFPDSIIIDKNCSDEILNQNKPYIFKSTADLRAYLNEILEKNPEAIEKSTIDSKIHLFLYCGEEAYLLNPNDRDNDGVINEKDNCPDIAGEKSNSGCPVIIDTDGDGVSDDEDQCFDEPGEKECGGCVCPTPPQEPDDDRDGVANKKDKCPKEYGLKKYQGCPIPDSDGDGVNDEIDKCPSEKGPSSNNGCPLIIRITHNNEDGKFIVGGSGFEFSKYKVYMKIKQSASGPAKGAILTHEFTHNVCPFSTSNDHFEATKLIKALKDPSNLTVTIYVDDKNGNNIKTTEFKNLSMICFAGIDADCGFVDLDKTN